MAMAQVIHEQGPPEAMCWQEWPVPDPGPGEVCIRHTAIGVNFADTYHRAAPFRPRRPNAGGGLRDQAAHGYDG
jgi:NADPH2:quinone reductase